MRTRRGGHLDTEPASLAIFDHAIVYVPKLDRYLDGTAEFSGLAELPAQDQGVVVLRVGPRGSVLTQTPVLPSSENHVQRRWQVALEASGDARVDEELIIRGQAAPNWREHYQTEGERKDRYGRVWSGRFPGARLDSVAMPAIEDRNAPVTVRRGRDGAAARRARRAGSGLELPVTGRDADFVRTYARLSARRQELVLGYPWQHDEELTYRLPAGWRLAAGAPPARRVIDGPFGRFSLDVEIDGSVLRVRSSLNVTRARINADDYPKFRAFLLEVDAALASPIGVFAAGAGGIMNGAPAAVLAASRRAVMAARVRRRRGAARGSGEREGSRAGRRWRRAGAPTRRRRSRGGGARRRAIRSRCSGARASTTNGARPRRRSTATPRR